MSNLGSLLKVQFSEIFSLNRNNKKEVKKAIGVGSAVAALIALSLFISICYNYLIYTVYKERTEAYLTLVFILTTLVIFVTGIIKVKATLFGNKDYNLLESLPLKHSAIIFSKIFVIYLYELIFSVAFLAPAITIVAINGFDIYVTIISFFAMLALPIAPILVGGIIGLPMAFIFDKTKFGSYITLVLYVVYIVALMYFVYGKSTPEGKASMYDKMIFNVNKFYFVSKWFYNGLFHDIKYVIMFFGFNVLFVLVFVMLASLCYKPINANIMSKSIKVAYKSKKLESSSAGKAILKNEFKRITASSNILLNSLLGGIMSIIMLIIFYSSFKEPLGDDFEKYARIIYPFMTITICFGLGMAPISTSNISLEGEAFWILKTAPVKPSTIVKNKTIASIILLAPFSVIASVILIVLFKVNVWGSIASVAIPLLYVVLISLAGMDLQLKNPKLHFKNELEVLKRGKAAIIVTFVSLVFEIVIAGILIGLGIFVNMYLAFAAVVLAELVGIIGYTIYLNKNCSRLFNAIE